MLLVATSASAALMSSFQSSASGTPVYTLTSITPNGGLYQLDDVRVFIGLSSTSPCSDLMSIGSVPSDNLVVMNGDEQLYSKDFQDFVINGSQVTCMKMDMIAQGKTYTTGNMQLVWNHGVVERVIPNHSTMDFTK